MSNKILEYTKYNFFIVSLTISLFGCNNTENLSNISSVVTTTPPPVPKNLPKVVATTSVICNLTKQIAGDTINLTCLIPANTDPHLYQPKPEDTQAINQAKLVLYNGYNLEQTLIKVIRNTQNSAPKIAVAQIAVPTPQRVKIRGKNLIDPHIWHNAKYGIKMVDVISSNLSKMEPKNNQIYAENTARIKSELTQLDAWIQSRITSIPDKQRQLITTHDAMGYYAKAYGFSLAGAFSGITTQQKTSNSRFNALVKGIQKAKVRTIFPEHTIDSNVTQTIAKQANVKVSQRKLYTDGIGKPGSDADTYQKMMTANTRTILEGLGGTYLIFEPKASN